MEIPCSLSAQGRILLIDDGKECSLRRQERQILSNAANKVSYESNQLGPPSRSIHKLKCCSPIKTCSERLKLSPSAVKQISSCLVTPYMASISPSTPPPPPGAFRFSLPCFFLEIHTLEARDKVHKCIFKALICNLPTSFHTRKEIRR